MKKVIFLLIIGLCLQGYSQSNSVLNNGDWYKFAIDTTGVFKIDANFLSSLGLNTNGINPKNIKIYGNGGNLLPQQVNHFRYNDLQENAIFIKGEDDGVFNSDDYILFYGRGPHSWNINDTFDTITHVQNIYNNHAYYFITVDDSPGKRINAKNQPTNNAATTITNYDDYTFYEKEDRNLFGVGQVWVGEDFTFQNQQSFSIPFPNTVNGSDILIRVRGVASSSRSSSFNVQANNQNVTTVTINQLPSSPNNKTLAISNSNQGTITTTSDNINITLTYNNNGIPSAKGYLDFIEIIGKKELEANGNQFSFRSFEAANSSGVFNYRIKNNSNIDQVWEVTDFLNPKSIDNTATSNDFEFKSTGGGLEEYVVINLNDTYTPIREGNAKVNNQNLHALNNIEYLVITNNDLVAQAQRLANYHSTTSNLTSQVITLDKVYNEFSSGSKDITGIRDFIKYLHNNSSADKKLKYVCFFGDTSYDFKDRIQNNNNIVPSFHATYSFDLVNSFVTDDYFVMIKDTDGNMNGTDTMDITSGRIPVATVQEAQQTVDRILNYYSSNTLGNWRNTVTLIADDADGDSDLTLQPGMEAIADEIVLNKPAFNLNKIYADAFKQEVSSGGQRYPEVQEAITNAIEKGSLVLDYFGHGGENGFASERILETPQIEGFNNYNTLPLFITVTCEFSRFDNPLRIPAGERLFLNANGGTISMISTTREIYISTGELFNKRLTRFIFNFNDTNNSIAGDLTATKNITNSIQKFFIYYFGDPAMRLAIPKPNIVLTKVNDIDISQPIDTLKALSKIKLSGIITDTNNNLLTNYNGTLTTTIYDKPVDKQTLNNDGQGSTQTFDVQESKIFSGKASIENGMFNFDFIVPKDIKIAYGKGKVSMYAENQIDDKGGANFDLLIGGINNNAPEDTVGPQIQAFMNDESFIDGGTTNESPNLVLKLEDISGINTSITAVDHDITAILDGNEGEPIILNDFYQTELDDYTKGTVTYKLRNLSVGTHTLKIKAWDTYNNSSETTLTFTVISDSKLVLSNVLNYPNPFVSYTEFWFNHNKPNEPLEVQVQIFTVSGKLVKTLNQLVQTNGSLSRSITWDGLDDFGNKIGKGVYIYKLTVNATLSNLSSEKYEKLVIL